MLDGKVRSLRKMGMGKLPNRKRSLTSNEEEIFWKCGQFIICYACYIVFNAGIG